VGVVFALSVISQEVNVSKGIVLPSDSRVFVMSQFSDSYFTLVLYLIAVTLGSASIVPDFEKQTGHMLFPKVSRAKLLVGRFCALYLFFAAIISEYYGLVSLYTRFHYADVPWEIWESFGMALLVAFAVLSFVFFISSWMKSVAGTAILGILLFIIGFTIMVELVTLLTTTEPIWILTYYTNIIANIINMPTTRYSTRTVSAGALNITVTTWITPDVPTAIIGSLIYAGLSLLLSYLIFRRRQLAS